MNRPKAVLTRTPVLLPYGHWKLELAFLVDGRWQYVFTTTN